VVRPLTIVPADDWTQAPSRVPFWLSRRRQMFWYTYLPHERTLYAQINNVLNAPDESLAHFSSRLIAAITKYKPARFVLDLRRNTGGDNTLLRPLLTGLVQSPVNRSNALFVLTGPQTFSAAQNLCNRLQYYTDAIFIGQPTADNVNFYADAKPIVLPNSRIAINISHLYWQDSDPRDGRAALYPDVAVDPTLDDFLNGRDPALQEALTHTPETPLEERLRSAASSGFDRAYAEYQAYVRDPRHEYVHGLEARLNSLGYELLSEKAYAKAVAVLRINTVEHPESSNAWDSLGDAYSSAGLKNDAVAAYRYSLQIDPANRDASRSLQSLEP
jgi:tetratricopeptide (TPR) repeat protein